MHKLRWLAVWALCSLAAGAHAQVSAADKATAEALFDRGLALMREGKLQEACARFEESNAVEHGIGTMLYLADCYEQSGRTASAWALFREASSEAQAAGQSERAQAGRQRAARLEPSLSRLVIEVPGGHHVNGLEVLRNGTIVTKGVWGEPLPVDPGEHHVVARAPGYHAREQTITVERGANVARVEIPKLEPAPVAAAPTPVEAPPAAVTPAVAAVAASEPAPALNAAKTERGRGQRLTGIILGSAGVAMLAVGVGFGVRAMKLDKDTEDLCPDNRCRTKPAQDDRKSALSASRVATAGLVTGGALLAGGVITYFLAPRSDKQVALSVDKQSASLVVGGVF